VTEQPLAVGKWPSNKALTVASKAASHLALPATGSSTPTIGVSVEKYYRGDRLHRVVAAAAARWFSVTVQCSRDLLP
jgi:hypothetical protein